MQYQIHPRYKFFALLAWGLVLLFAWSLYQSFAGDTFFFLLVCLGVGIWYTLVWFSHVRLSANGIAHDQLLGATQEVEFRQLVSVSESGRIGRSITLIYHPVQNDGFLDLNQVRSLNLPEVVKQHELVEHLAERVPK